MVPDPYSSQDFNRYMYVKGNPIKYQDPTGHVSMDSSAWGFSHKISLHSPAGMNKILRDKYGNVFSGFSVSYEISNNIISITGKRDVEVFGVKVGIRTKLASIDVGSLKSFSIAKMNGKYLLNALEKSVKVFTYEDSSFKIQKKYKLGSFSARPYLKISYRGMIAVGGDVRYKDAGYSAEISVDLLKLYSAYKSDLKKFKYNYYRETQTMNSSLFQKIFGVLGM